MLCEIVVEIFVVTSHDAVCHIYKTIVIVHFNCYTCLTNLWKKGSLVLKRLVHYMLRISFYYNFKFYNGEHDKPFLAGLCFEEKV